MATCESTDFIFPLLADIYYPLTEQGAYGNVKKTWVLDRGICCNFNSSGNAGGEDVKPNANITKEMILIGRTKTDVRISSLDDRNSITNVIITNIRTSDGEHIYKETAGPRSGKSTIFEVAAYDPFVGPFGRIEHYALVIRRSENQGIDV
jgi:hypothetical protein